MTHCILNGGPFGGLEVDATGWATMAIREFRDQDGTSAFYRNDPGEHMTYVGAVNPLAAAKPDPLPVATLDKTVVTVEAAETGDIDGGE